MASVAVPPHGTAKAPFSAGRFWGVRLVSVLAVLGILVAFHFLVVPNLGIFDHRLLVNALLFGTLAVSLNLINGITGQFSIGHAAFYLVGALGTGKLSLWLYNEQTPGWLWLLLMVIVGGVMAGVAGFLVGLPSLRLRGDYLAIVTMGFGEIARVIAINQDGRTNAFSALGVVQFGLFMGVLSLYIYLWQRHRPLPKAPELVRALVGMAGFLILARLVGIMVESTIGPTLESWGKLNLGGAIGLQDVPKLTEIAFILLLFILTVAVARNLLKTSHGLAFLAVREDELAADATGVNATRIKVTAFVLGAAIAGMAGALFAHYNGSVSPDDFKMDVSFILVAMVVIGGTGSITGAALAGIGLKLLEELLRDLRPIPAGQLFAAILAVAIVSTLYGLLKRRFQFSPDGPARLPLTGLGGLGVLGLGYVVYLAWTSDLATVHKVAGVLVFSGAIASVVAPRMWRTAMPRFGTLVVSLVLVGVLIPVLQGAFAATPLNDYLTKTTYSPGDIRWAVFAIALILVMLLRPQGLLGHHEFSWKWAREHLVPHRHVEAKHA